METGNEAIKEWINIGEVPSLHDFPFSLRFATSAKEGKNIGTYDICAAFTWKVWMYYRRGLLVE